MNELKASPVVFKKMKERTFEYHTKPENIENRISKVKWKSDVPITICKNLVWLMMLRQANKVMQR